MKKISLIAVCMLLFMPIAFGQVLDNAPEWVKENLKNLEGKDSKVVVIKGEFGKTVEDAEQKALQKLINQECRNNEDYRIVDKYITYNSDRTWAYCYLLVQVCKNKNCGQWENLELFTTKYPFSGRVFVPGMAQIYKGSKVKGGLIIGGEVLGVAGIVTSFSMKGIHDYYLSDSSLSMADNEYHNQSSDMWRNIGFGSIAFTAAIYIYNIIDGAVAPGKKHHQLGSKSYEISFAPTATIHGDYGFAARINF